MAPKKKSTRPQVPKIRYGVVGLGYFAQTAILPAFKHAKGSVLAALVSDDAAKLKLLGRRYGVETRVGYDGYDALLAGDQIDAVYIALPNSLHRDYAERAARAGVHVLCEKPLGVTVEDCEAIIAACDDHDVKLMTGYRLHFEEANLTAIDLAQKKKLGEVRLLNATFTMNVKPGNIRVDRDLGGGPLWDIGIYCINAARNVFHAEPTEVYACAASKPHDARWAEVPEQVAATLRFPGERLASFIVSFGASDVSAYEIVGTKGSLRVDPGFDFAKDLVHTLRAGGKEKRRVFKKRDQVAPEISYFSDCIVNDREPEPSGREGLADVRVIQALYQAMRKGRPMRLDDFEKEERPTLAQEDREPLGKEPELFHAEQPSA